MKLSSLILPALLLLPVVEIYTFVVVGGWIGAGPTVALVVLAALVGLGRLQRGGLETLMRARAAMAAGIPPERELLEGALAMLGGLLLLIPGFVTDLLGIALLVPAIRVRLAARAVRAAGVRAGARVIDGEYRRVDEAGAPGLDSERRDRSKP